MTWNEVVKKFRALRDLVTADYVYSHREFLLSAKVRIKFHGDNTASKKELLEALDRACTLLLEYSDELERLEKRNA